MLMPVKRILSVACAILMLLALAPAHAESAPFSVLLIGVDTAGEAGRSDTMMLVSIAPDTGRVRLVSFLRDLYVSIPGHGRDRLNAAYFYGGEALLARTLEKNFGVKINHTATVHFPTLVAAIDLLGGVDVEVSEAELDQLNHILQRYNRQSGLPDGDGLLTEAGVHTLSGKQALSYCRIRKIDSDFQRTQRQQRVLQAAADRLLSQDPLSLLRLALSLLDEVETDLTLGDLAPLLPLLAAPELDIRSAHVPFDGAYADATINGMMVLEPDLAVNRARLKRFLE